MTTNVTTLSTLPAFDTLDPSTFVQTDLDNTKSKTVLAAAEYLAEEASKVSHHGALPVHTGWNEITPTIAIDLLMRNRKGANRKINPARVVYYARQMLKGNWKKTGQPVLVDSNGVLLDSQHRLLACLLAGIPFTTYVVTEIEPIHNLFAYIDNVAPRNAAAALQTAGWNGVSSIIARMIRIGEEARLGVYNPTSGLGKLPPMAPIEVLELADNYPNAQKAARSTVSDWTEAVDYIGGRKEVIAYLGMVITDAHDEYVAEDFFEALISDEERQPDDPIARLRKLIDKDRRAERGMRRHHLLASLILAFNAWHKGESLGPRWVQAVDEDFPAIHTDAETQEAAE